MVFALSTALLACSHTHSLRIPDKAQLLPFERIHKNIRKAARLRKGQRMLFCNSLVFMGRTYPPAGEPDPLDEINVADGPATYYDNADGTEYARCDFWYC